MVFPVEQEIQNVLQRSISDRNMLSKVSQNENNYGQNAPHISRLIECA